MVDVNKLKLRNLLTVFVVLLLLPLSLGAAGSQAQAATLATVSVTVEGEPLVMPVPPVIVNDRTLVGVRFVGEAVGGTVEWDQAKRQATVTRGSDTVVVTLDQKQALVNGSPVTLEVAARLVDERTMVPLRFIAEALGGTVEWDDATRTVNILRKPTAITGMAYQRGVGSSTLRLSLSEPLISMTPAVDGRSLVYELYPAEIALANPSLHVFDNLINAIQLEASGRTVKLKTLFWYDPFFRQSLSADGKELLLEFDHKLTGIQFQQNGRIPLVNVGATGKLDYSISQLQDPTRLVLDVAGGPLPGRVPAAIEVGNPVLTRARSAQFSAAPEVHRIVLDMPETLPYDLLTTDFGLQVQFVPRLQSITKEQVAGKTRLTIAANLPVDARVTALPEQRRITIEVPQGRSDLRENLLTWNDGTINSLRITQGASPNSSLITIDLPYYIGHTLLSKDGDKAIVLDLVTSPIFGKRIWVDAGHGKVPGGRDDPGAIGRVYGVVEKDVNLKVSLELQRQLEAFGAVVLMTRTGDEGIDFRDRPALVNAANPPADLFVSVHHNSAANTAARGVETYFWTTNPKSKTAAEQIHAAILRGLGFPDRQVRQQAFNVIRDTRAPSVLLELGYLSNAEEEKAVADPGYPRKAAEAITNGIMEYFRQEIR